MKFKRLTAVFTAAVMAFSMATAASAEDDFNGNPALNSVSVDMPIDYNFNDEIDSSMDEAAAYAALTELCRSIQTIHTIRETEKHALPMWGVRGLRTVTV